jgi:hypothetical protein
MNNQRGSNQRETVAAILPAEVAMRSLTGFAVLPVLFAAIGCTRIEEHRHEAEANAGEVGAMNEDPSDPRNWKTFLRIGFLEERPDGAVVCRTALQQPAAERILDRYIDRDNNAAVVGRKPSRDGDGVILGSIQGVPILLRDAGELHVPDGRMPERLEAFVTDFCRELRCTVCVQAAGGVSSKLIRFVPE